MSRLAVPCAAALALLATAFSTGCQDQARADSGRSGSPVTAVAGLVWWC